MNNKRNFYFFQKDGGCSYMKKEIAEYFPKYLHEEIPYGDKKVKFYCVLKWVKRENKGANMEMVLESGINYVSTIDELPEGAGVYVTGYDIDLNDYEAIKRRNIPIIERPCPWIKQLREQLLRVNHATHQAVLMIYRGHMVYDCYKSAFPDDIIIIQPDTYKEAIEKHNNGKPIHLLVYAAFRKKDAIAVIDYINRNHPHPDNILDGYKKTLCIWTRQGLFEEIEQAIHANSLHEIWILCSSEKDTSTQSIIREVVEHGARPHIIITESDIPASVTGNGNIGVLFAAIPLSSKQKKYIDIIKKRFSIGY